MMAAGAIDVCNYDASWGGGPTEWRRIAALAAVLRRPAGSSRGGAGRIPPARLAAARHLRRGVLAGARPDLLADDREPARARRRPVPAARIGRASAGSSTRRSSRSTASIAEARCGRGDGALSRAAGPTPAAGRRATARPRAGRPGRWTPGDAAIARGKPVDDHRRRRQERPAARFDADVQAVTTIDLDLVGGLSGRPPAGRRAGSSRSRATAAPSNQPVACWLAPAVRPGGDDRAIGSVSGRSRGSAPRRPRSVRARGPWPRPGCAGSPGSPHGRRRNRRRCPARNASGVEVDPERRPDARPEHAHVDDASRPKLLDVPGQARQRQRPEVQHEARVRPGRHDRDPVGRRQLDDPRRLLGIARPDEREVLGRAHDRRAASGRWPRRTGRTSARCVAVATIATSGRVRAERSREVGGAAEVGGGALDPDWPRPRRRAPPSGRRSRRPPARARQRQLEHRLVGLAEADQDGADRAIAHGWPAIRRRRDGRRHGAVPLEAGDRPGEGLDVRDRSSPPADPTAGHRTRRRRGPRSRTPRGSRCSR